MTMYNVHIYREMRLYFPGIAATTPEEAAGIADEKPTRDAGLIDDCDGETLAALVDVVHDENYEHSRLIDFAGERMRKEATELLAALQEAVAEIEYCHAELLTEEERRHPRGSGLARIYDRAKAAIASATAA